MKKLMIAISMFMMFFVFSLDASALSKKTEKEELTLEQKERLTEIEKRVDEIKAMDFSEMNNLEKKEVRSELREMKAEAKRIGGGIYISLGAVIIIVLLIIIL